MPVLVKRAGEYRAFRIAPADTNYMICLYDPIADAVDFTLIVEVYERGGRTPPNMHTVAHELFWILQGEGVAHADGNAVSVRRGDSVLLRPGTEHVLENTGAGKLYAVCLMVPDEAFAALIRGGTPVALDAEDRAVLGA